MFEKEAEEYTVENVCSSCYFEKPCENKCEAFGCADSKTYVLKAFKDGAEFGYNKANEWHYVKDELPPEDTPLLCVRGGRIYVAWYWDNIYHDSKCCQVKKPYAWKEIVLPELKESK